MRKLLIANRGEIACRIMRTCRSLGIPSVAVYSEADAQALHVELADEAVAIGPAPARESYLVVERILEAARSTGADAVHPGYGFLSENAGFARAVQGAGLLWIGPDPQSIEAMGDKQVARGIAAAAGVPVLPGSRRFTAGDLDDIEGAAETVGYPLLVKAAGGGGGIGMRRVEDATGLREVTEATQSMAGKAFGDASVYLERLVPRARHVEVQVFGDGQGGAIHHHERDCSLQRRFQKVVEESPAPGLPEAVRASMLECAVQLCAHQRYRGAGTVEFVVDADTFEFFFLEMNTRIQVEHPVTEMCTGRDLIAMQLELASGALSGLDQHAVRHRGHAIECRLYAENPAKNFMPSPGKLERFDLPRGHARLRVDTGFRGGDTVTFFYDPMLAKIIAHGNDRAAAIAALDAALATVAVEGIATNAAFVRACLAHPEFQAGEVSTDFLDRHRKALVAASKA